MQRGAAQQVESTSTQTTARTSPQVSAIAGLEAQVRLQADLAHRLRTQRQERGALDLETIEAQPVTSACVSSTRRRSQTFMPNEIENRSTEAARSATPLLSVATI